MAKIRTRTIGVLVAGLTLCIAGLFWPTLGRPRRFTVAVNIWPGAEQLLSARGHPALKGSSVMLMEFSWSAAVTGAFQKRVADAAVVSLDELLRLEAADAQPQAVLVLGTSLGSDALLARSGISDTLALRGKRVGVELHSAGEYFLAGVLKKNGMTFADVEIVPLNLAETESAFLERDLDAVVTADPWRARLMSKDAVLIADSRGLGLEMSRVLVVRRDEVGLFRDEISRLIQVSMKHGASFWTADDLAAVLRREDLTQAQWDDATRVVHMPDSAENQRLLGNDLQQALLKVAENMLGMGWIEAGKTIDVSLLLNADFVKEER